MRQKSGPAKAAGRAGREGHPPSDAAAVFGRREDPHRAGWLCAARTASPSCAGAKGIAQSLYYSWSKEFLEAGKKRLAGDTARAATSATRSRICAARPQALKEVVAELTLENRLLKKSMIADGEDEDMRYPASEKLEIIRLVEQSHLPVRRTLDKLGIPRATFYRWYDRYQSGGPEALEDRSPTAGPGLEPHPRRGPQPRSSTWRWTSRSCRPRELAVRFTDTKQLLRLGSLGLSAAEGA